jgi:iron complex outermembrane receptor protein
LTEDDAATDDSGDRLRGLVKVENLFNAAYESHYGYPDDGTRFVAGLQMKL